MLEGEGLVLEVSRGYRVGEAREALLARAPVHVAACADEVVIAAVDALRDRRVHPIVEVRLDPARAEVEGVAVVEYHGLARPRDSHVDVPEMRGGLDDEPVHAEREHLLHVGLLAQGIKVRVADNRLIARRRRHALDSGADLPGPDVGVVEDEDGDDSRRLARQASRLDAGDVAGLLNGTPDALARRGAHLVELVIEVVGDRRRGGVGELGDICDGDAARCHGDSLLPSRM